MKIKKFRSFGNEETEICFKDLTAFIGNSTFATQTRQADPDVIG